MNELSGYLLARSGGLMVLTLVATTLPAEAAYVTAPRSCPDATRNGRDTNPASPSHGTESPSPSSEKAPDSGAGNANDHLLAALPTLWSGNDSRSATSGAGPDHLSDLNAEAPDFRALPQAQLIPLRVLISGANPLTEGSWLSCRYAHAPPAC